jgi:DUF1365 family protein
MRHLYTAYIFHKRHHPKTHCFEHRGFYILVDIDDLENLESLLFSYNRFNLFSFFDKDHGDRLGGNLRAWALDKLERSGVNDFNGEILLQTFPRVLGHVFNPVSFWFCKSSDKIIAIICEVNNTFGESHCYVLTDRPDENIHQIHKEFHVSPFYDVQGYYQFDFTMNNLARINFFIENELQLNTFIKGEEICWNSFNFLKLFIKFPIYSFTILFNIHFQALKLFLKRIKFHSKPEGKHREVTYEHSSYKP